MKTIKKSFQLLNWKLLITIFVTLLIPVIYRTTRIFFVGSFQDTYKFSIAGNLEWINVIFEILEEAILLPLFFTLKNIMDSKDEEIRNRRFSFQLILISIIYAAVILIFVIFTREMMSWMSVNTINNTSISFVRIEFFTRFFVMIGKVGAIVLIAKNKWKLLITLLAVSTTLNFFFDLFITSNNPISLNLGITWIGWSQLIVASTISIIYLISIYKVFNYKAQHLLPIAYWNKKNFSQNIYSGLESLVRNAFFIVIVIKTVNKLASGYNQGDFWVMNSFVWDWMLLPILSISQYLNRDQAFKNERIGFNERIAAPIFLILITIICWFITIPAYKPFIKVVMNNEDYELINHLVIISLAFYVTMAINDPIDKIMIGDGKAQLILLQSLFVNVIVNIPYYFFTTNMTIDDIAIMMGTGILVDSFLTWVIFFFWYKKNIKGIEYKWIMKLKRVFSIRKKMKGDNNDIILK